MHLCSNKCQKLQGSTHKEYRDFQPHEFHGTIKTLIPGKNYIFQIQAETKVGYGPEATWKQKMPILGKYNLLKSANLYSVPEIYFVATE